MRDFSKKLVRMSTAHRWMSIKKNTCPQYEEEQIEPLGTTSSNFSDEIAVTGGQRT